MARARRISKTLDKAQQRAAGLASISPTLDLGSNLTLTAFKTANADTQARLDAYNAAIVAGEFAAFRQSFLAAYQPADAEAREQNRAARQRRSSARGPVYGCQRSTWTAWPGCGSHQARTEVRG
jgi:hypothetical protein